MTTWQSEGWSSDKVVDELKERTIGGRSIRFTESRKDEEFKDAIYRHFGGWPGALKAAGLHPKTRLINYWTEDEVTRRIRGLAESGQSINTLHLELHHPRLWNAARRLFGSIQKAVEASGFNYSDIKKRGNWTDESIKAKIRDYYERGEDISQISMLKLDSRLLAAGQKFFGAWSKAVTAAGINYMDVKSRHRDIKGARKSSTDERRQRKVFVMRSGQLVQTE